MSSLKHLVNMGLRYGRSKGVQVTRQEDGVIGNLAVTRHLEESASHHDSHVGIKKWISTSLFLRA